MFTVIFNKLDLQWQILLINCLRVVTLLNDQVTLPLLAPNCSMNCKVDPKMRGIHFAAAYIRIGRGLIQYKDSDPHRCR